MTSGLGAGESEGDSSRNQKLWAVLLVLDAFLVIIFGGALAAKLYQHWQSPPQLPPPPVQVHRAKPAPPAPKLAEEPAPPAAKPAEPTQAAPAKPANNPAFVQEAPKPREAPKLQEAAKATTPAGAVAPIPAAALAAPQPSAKVKAKAVKFQIKAPGAKNVELWGGFIRGGRKAMTQESDGMWTLTLYLTPATYRYLYLVDGIKTLDPENARTERNASAVTVAQ
ncbi:MAG: hypothetical protein HY921_09790 [Elusimicrobia bacterium]|nr:hypothetical protein [Elusimicrobiota bacterium]